MTSPEGSATGERLDENDPTFVDANQRYASATQETVARIQARDLAVVGFVTFAGALITVSTREHYEWISVSVGYIALAAALLSFHHDVIIGQLGLFQHNLCKDSRAENWFSWKYFRGTLKARLVRDFYFIFLIGVGVAIGLTVSYEPLVNVIPPPPMRTFHVSPPMVNVHPPMPKVNVTLLQPKVNISPPPFGENYWASLAIWASSLVSGIASIATITWSFGIRLMLHRQMGPHESPGAPPTDSKSTNGESTARPEVTAPK